MNDEARTTNDETITKHEGRKAFAAVFCHFIIRHSFGRRHSSFVIL